MAAEKTTRRKKKADAKGGEGGGGPMLRTRTDPRKERRYEPKTSAMALVSVVAMSIGAVVVGAGTYAQWFRGEELGPLKQAPYLLAGGAFLLIAVALFGQRMAKPVRVGDAGVALEKEPGEIERIEWRDVTRLILSSDALTVQSPGTNLSVPLGAHLEAAKRIAAEVRVRLPKRAGDLEGGPSLGEPDDGVGEVLALDAVQVAGAHCKKTDKLIAFEKDARLCGSCGEVYHKDSVPARCLTCDAKLT